MTEGKVIKKIIVMLFYTFIITASLVRTIVFVSLFMEEKQGQIKEVVAMPPSNTEKIFAIVLTAKFLIK